MSQDFGSLQQSLKQQSAHLTAEVKSIAERVLTLLDGKLAEGTKELKDGLVTLESELQRFHEVVDHPEIIFATTGTTSSGKSTLVNLLCGAFIMPEAVGEMSAGVVEIEHGEQTSVEIFPTQGASWEIGRYEELSDDELQGLLTRVMHAYNDRREDPNVPECPRVKVTYPTRLGLEISSFGLPPNMPFSLKILDLPGLKHVSDSQNAEVINSYCKRAMSFVTYNAAETDAHKQESLLKQVVGQVKEIGGTPARMMFILNRFDVYEQDSNPEESKARAFNITQSKIREVLARELPEYKAEAQAITPVKLATKPALLVERGEFKEIERFFGYLVDEDVMDELPRKIEKWSDEDHQVFSNAVFKGCYVREFRELLQKHVHQHLPQILFPSPLAELKEKGLERLLYRTAQQIQIVMETATKGYQESTRELEVLEQSMQHSYAEFATKYHSITQLNPTEIPVTFIKAFSLVEELGNRLTPLAKFTEITEMVTNTIVDAVIDTLVDGSPLPQELIDTLPQHDLHLLNKALDDLKSAGYHSALANQGHAHYEERSGTGFLPKLNMALNQLSSVVAKVLPNLINITLNRESKRIVGAISFMVEVITERLHEQALSVIDGRLPLSPPQLQELNHDLKPITAHFQMSGGFSTSSQSRNEKVGTSYEKVGEKRTWYTLFIGKKDVYDYVDKFEQRSYDNASIPSIYDVADGWVHQIEGALSEYSQEIQKRVETKLNESYANVVNSQQQSFSEFKQRLEEASHELGQAFQDNTAPWKALKDQHSNLQERVHAFTVRS